MSHPIQYYVPLYRRLAKRDDIDLKVFFTWHAGQQSQYDPGFQRDVAWDIPLTSGYDYELLTNTARRPGSDHFWGIRNPTLVKRIRDWRPDAVHITGYAYASHLRGMRAFYRLGLPVLFRGDSHLLGRKPGLLWQMKRQALRGIYQWARTCLYVGKHNHDYFREAGVPESRLAYCPHSIEVERFANPNSELEDKARRWRNELGIPDRARTLLFAGKFERKKRPLELMKAAAAMRDVDLVLIMVGSGDLENEVQSLARQFPQKFRLLPFQNQRTMPVVYRLGDIFALPSAFDETWGLAVNEALACGRRVLISDKVGCAPDVVTSKEVGSVFTTLDDSDFGRSLRSLLDEEPQEQTIRKTAARFDVTVTERTLVEALKRTVGESNPESSH
ncbi:MAG TPA: glycosyltransferase family 4 protein [Terriglobales bacterium]|nr:glycosyltransferase family 4 protein [Terriglobales bacterium]